MNNGPYQPFTGTIGAAYHTIRSDYLPAYQKFRHPEAEAPWLYDPASGTMLSYDDPESIGRKTDYAWPRVWAASCSGSCQVTTRSRAS